MAQKIFWNTIKLHSEKMTCKQQSKTPFSAKLVTGDDPEAKLFRGLLYKNSVNSRRVIILWKRIAAMDGGFNHRDVVF
ncbi:MAG: hypothetical protein P4M14_06150 [Gammaproteobacteria bacterium]|nr:hypothetical protein [Gammaproteobacteria bacterium]